MLHFVAEARSLEFSSQRPASYTAQPVRVSAEAGAAVCGAGVGRGLRLRADCLSLSAGPFLPGDGAAATSRRSVANGKWQPHRKWRTYWKNIAGRDERLRGGFAWRQPEFGSPVRPARLSAADKNTVHHRQAQRAGASARFLCSTARLLGENRDVAYPAGCARRAASRRFPQGYPSRFCR